MVDRTGGGCIDPRFVLVGLVIGVGGCPIARGSSKVEVKLQKG
jgi:hypothetical protein